MKVIKVLVNAGRSLERGDNINVLVADKGVRVATLALVALEEVQDEGGPDDWVVSAALSQMGITSSDLPRRIWKTMTAVKPLRAAGKSVVFQ